MLITLPKDESGIVKNWRQNEHAIEKYSFIHHFIPHPHFKTRAKLLSPKAVLTYCFLLLVVAVGVKTFTKTFPGVLGYASNINVKDLLNLTNKKRDEIDLGDLRLNPELTKAAEKKAADMFKYGYWAHVSPQGKEPWDFILSENYDYTYAGENLAKNFSNSRDVVDAWYNSPSHKENLLNKNYQEVGFAVVNGVMDGYETTLVVQMFGKPRNPGDLATAEDQDRILSSLATQRASSQPVEAPKIALNKPLTQKTAILPSFDISTASRSITIVFISFLAGLLLLDIWYSRKKSIAKVTGHSFAHITFLIIILVGVLFALLPGKIL